ncbi:hypothetical protein GCM10023085_45660 [Actinomadura viridis]|uniref:Uncharacterized protein YlaI n=1 Tax=Actinomadura viridis TaxID=58110 RepID=A0A931DLS1_9ACTN|nr:DUF6221 family protein [Actinomadura viridis]MBG6089926.1 uncharacterized protein YlaI [Actinomadura viridis]
MSDLVKFLHARLNESERVERGKFKFKPFQVICPTCGERVESFGMQSGDNRTEFQPCGHIMSNAEFSERFCDPAPDSFTLADIESKRRIVDEYEASVRAVGEGLSKTLERILRLLAQPYANDPDYLEEWRP